MSALGFVVTVPASASRTSGITAGSSAVTDTSVTAADAGRAVTGTGIPAGCVVGNVTASTGYNLYSPSDNGVVVPATVTNASAALTLGGILVFQLFDGVVWSKLEANKSTFPILPQYFLTGSENTPVPLLVVIPASAVYFGGAGVTSSSTGIGANLDGVPSFSYNAIGGDSLFAVVASSTASLQVLALRQ